ncbi:MAG TPA: type III pantothenate kinase [Burkholderiaceae bacterium]
MLLLIDAGNTRIKWALAAPAAALGEWHAHGAVTHADLPQLAEQIAENGVARVVLANVAGPAIRQQLLDLIGSRWPQAVFDDFLSTPECAGVRNGYREPGKLGCDRFAAAIGARALFPGRALVVATCGTATTVDALQPDGTFSGGMILPGLRLMAASLARGTAQLPEIDWQAADAASTVADNTRDAIASGCLAAQSGAIMRALDEQQARHGQGQVLCVLSGGAAPAIAPALCRPFQIVDNLVLTGLHASALGSASALAAD